MVFKKDMLIGTALGLVLGCSGAIFAQTPVVNIGDRHGNLRAAQQSIVSAPGSGSTKHSEITTISLAAMQEEPKTCSYRRMRS
jgi:hypothetical protein